MKEVTLSIIIVNYKSKLYLQRCLRSLERLPQDITREVIVVENASHDGSLAMLRWDFPEVIYIINEKNRGFARAMNQGFKLSRGKFILWLNPDTEYLEGDLEACLKYFEQEEKLGILGLQISDPDGRIQHSCRDFPSYEHFFFGKMSLLTRLFPQNPVSRKYLYADWDHRTVQDVDWVSGACLLHRRELLEDVGLLDEKFFMYFEDVDFCRRARLKGWTVRYYPQCRFLHHIGGSSRKVSRRTLLARHYSNWHYYVKYFRRNPVKDVVVAAGLILRSLLNLIIVPDRRKDEVSRSKGNPPDDI